MPVQNANAMRTTIQPTESNRHRLLAGITRSRLLAVLREAGRPLGVRDLASAVALHPNSVREQLEPLVAAGLVVRSTDPPAGRGRPALRYAAAATKPADDEAPYRELARVLAEELGRRPDASERSLAAGERWGRAAAATERTLDEGDARARLVRLLDENGFAPEPPIPGEPIRLRRCPFGQLARDRGDVVCGVHLGLIRGALQELGAPLDAVRLEPFVAPDLCLAHLARVDARAQGGGPLEGPPPR
jgi:predicted ArsR family transcriptional regulator